MEKRQITERALFQRLQRHLEKEDGCLLRKSREGRNRFDLGTYYAIDVKTGIIAAKHIDLEEWSRKSGLLSKHETVINS